jgi:hypothetical protein
MPKQTESVVFNGFTFTRFPLSKSRSSRVYFTAYANSRRIPGMGQLHVEVWKAANGVEEVPRGRVIHHVDFNPLNNDPGNLRCVTRKEHAQIHEEQMDRDSPEWLEHLASIRPMAAEWHRTDEGREWHRQHAKDVYAKQEYRAEVCQSCSKPYETRGFKESRFCSRACMRRAADSVDRYRKPANCPICGGEFMQSKYSPVPATCSPSCGAHLRARNKAAGVRPDDRG